MVSTLLLPQAPTQAPAARESGAAFSEHRLSAFIARGAASYVPIPTSSAQTIGAGCPSRASVTVATTRYGTHLDSADTRRSSAARRPRTSRKPPLTAMFSSTALAQGRMREMIQVSWMMSAARDLPKPKSCCQSPFQPTIGFPRTPLTRLNRVKARMMPPRQELQVPGLANLQRARYNPPSFLRTAQQPLHPQTLSMSLRTLSLKWMLCLFRVQLKSPLRTSAKVFLPHRHAPIQINALWRSLCCQI